MLMLLVTAEPLTPSQHPKCSTGWVHAPPPKNRLTFDIKTAAENNGKQLFCRKHQAFSTAVRQSQRITILSLNARQLQPHSP